MTTTTTTKYELTDADRKQLDAIAQEASGKPKVNDTAWEVARDWFATLPVVSREAAERALGEVTDEEEDTARDAFYKRDGSWEDARKVAFDAVMVRRRAMLDGGPVVEPPKPKSPSREWLAKAADAEDAAQFVSVGGLAVDTGMHAAPAIEPSKSETIKLTQAEAEQLSDAMYHTKTPEGWPAEASAVLTRMGFRRFEPPKSETTSADDGIRERLDRYVREVVRERGERVRAHRDGDMADRIHWGVASAMTSLYDHFLRRDLGDDLGWSDGLGSNAPESTPEPQPAIDVVAELAELRKVVGMMLESQVAQRGALNAHAERLDTLSFRVNGLESAVRRKPWRWW